MRRILISLSLLLIALCPAVAQQLIPQFKPGEKVALIGDSITHGGHYHSYIWLYYMTRFPNMPITILNCGVGGDTASDILARLDYDVISKNPTYITLTFGMNDTGYFDVFNKDNTDELSAERVSVSIDNFGKIAEKLKETGAQIVMVGGSPYDETSRFNDGVLAGKNDAICKIIDAQRSVASSYGWGFVDFNAPMVELGQKLQAEDPKYSFCPQDRIHPDKDGQMVMAYLFLKAQGLAGRKVAGIDVNAKRGKVAGTEYCEVTNVRKENGGVSFDYLAESLPYPCDSISEHGWGNIHSQRDALKIIPFTEEFNQETLRVTGLEEGRYLFCIDGQPIDTLSTSALTAGVNMASYTDTPQYRQASAVMYLNEERLEVEKRFREYVWIEFNMFKGTDHIFADDWKSVEMVTEKAKEDWFVANSNYWYRKSAFPEIREVWKDYIDAIVSKIYTINKPVTRHISLHRL